MHGIKTRIANLSIKERAAFTVSGIILVIGVFGGLVALSNRYTTKVPISGGTYREGIVGSPRFVNPVLATSDSDNDLVSLVYSGLVRLDKDGNLVPDLASSWTISPDGKTYTVTMKPNDSFHDGQKVTAQDVAFTISKIQDPTLRSPLRVAWDGVTVTATDDTTVTFTLQKPYAGFLGQLTLGILPQHIWGSISDDAWQTSSYNTEPVGSGPYQIKSVSRDRTGITQKFVLKAFPRFALDKPLIKNVAVSVFADKSDAESALRSNDVDALALVDPGDIDTAKARRDTIITKPLPRVFGIFFNPSQNSLFADPTIVKALNLGTDRQALISGIFGGYGTALDGPLPSSIDTDTSDFATKQALAETLLDKDGWKMNPATGIRQKTTVTTSGTGKKKTSSSSSQALEFSLSTANTPDLEQSAQLIADQYKQLGIQVDVKIFEIGTLNENVIRNRNFEGLLFGQVVKNDTDIFAFWDSSQKVAPGLNITGYTNKQVDTLLESAIAEPDPAKRATIYQQVTAQLAKDAPVVFLYTPDYIELMNSRIHNVTIPPITTPSDRFSLIYQWYIETDRVWNAFLTH